MSTVRLATPDEYSRVGELTLAAYRALPVDHLWGGYDDSIRDVATRAKDAEVLVAVVDDEIAGAVTYVPDASSAWAEWIEHGEAQFRLLAVDPRFRGRGTGESLVRACIARASAAGKPIVIHTTKWLETAQRMYERLDFVRHPDRDVPCEVWNDPPIAGLPEAWIGEPFRAYIWTPAASA